MAVSFTHKARTHLWNVKGDLSKTTGKTVYRIYANEKTTPLAAYAYALATIGAIGHDYPASTAGTLPARELSCDPVNEARMEFDAEYSYDNSTTIVTDPLAAPTEFEIDNETFDEPFFEDKTPTTPVRAEFTNKVEFPEKPTRQASIRVYTVTKNVVSTKTMNDYDALQDTVNQNSVTFEGLAHAARTLLVAKVGLSKVQVMNGTSYRVLTTILRYKKSTWDQVYSSRHVKELVSGELKEILDSFNHPVESPYPLQTNGTKAASWTTAPAEITLKPYDQSSSLAAVI